eukprot:jgi/Mesvir1/745/Mv17346-RA.1
MAHGVSLAEAVQRPSGKYEVAAVVVEFDQPRDTRKTDKIMTIRIKDSSCANCDSIKDGLRVNVFAPSEESLPKVRSIGDVILIHKLEVRYWERRPQGSASVGANRPAYFALFDAVADDAEDRPYQSSHTQAGGDGRSHAVACAGAGVASWLPSPAQARQVALARDWGVAQRRIFSGAVAVAPGVSSNSKYLRHIDEIRPDNKYADVIVKVLRFTVDAATRRTSLLLWDGTDAYPLAHTHDYTSQSHEGGSGTEVMLGPAALAARVTAEQTSASAAALQGRSPRKATAGAARSVAAGSSPRRSRPLSGGAMDAEDEGQEAEESRSEGDEGREGEEERASHEQEGREGEEKPAEEEPLPALGTLLRMWLPWDCSLPVAQAVVHAGDNAGAVSCGSGHYTGSAGAGAGQGGGRSSLDRSHLSMAQGMSPRHEGVGVARDGAGAAAAHGSVEGRTPADGHSDRHGRHALGTGNEHGNNASLCSNNGDGSDAVSHGSGRDSDHRDSDGNGALVHTRGDADIARVDDDDGGGAGGVGTKRKRLSVFSRLTAGLAYAWVRRKPSGAEEAAEEEARRAVGGSGQGGSEGGRGEGARGGAVAADGSNQLPQPQGSAGRDRDTLPVGGQGQGREGGEHQGRGGGGNGAAHLTPHQGHSTAHQGQGEGKGEMAHLEGEGGLQSGAARMPIQDLGAGRSHNTRAGPGGLPSSGATLPAHGHVAPVAEYRKVHGYTIGQVTTEYGMLARDRRVPPLGAWVRLRNVRLECKDGSFVATWQDNKQFPSRWGLPEGVADGKGVEERERAYASRLQGNDVATWCKASRLMTTTLHEAVPLVTLRQVINHPQVTYKFRCKVRLVGVWPSCAPDWAVPVCCRRHAATCESLAISAPDDQEHRALAGAPGALPLDGTDMPPAGIPGVGLMGGNHSNSSNGRQHDGGGLQVQLYGSHPALDDNACGHGRSVAAGTLPAACMTSAQAVSLPRQGAGDVGRCGGCCGQVTPRRWSFGLKLRLADATGAVDALLCGHSAERFFQGVRACNLREQPEVVDALGSAIGPLLSPREGGDSAWMVCCLASYYLDKRWPRETRRYQVFDTLLFR